MSTMPLLKAKLKENIRKEATSLPVAMEAQTKTRTRQLALRAVNGDLNELDFANLDALGRIKGDLANTYIESVSAAKITSATMLATTLTLAGTDASNNKTSLVMIGDALMRVNDGTADRLRLSNAGMELAAADEGAVPANVAGRGLFNTGTHWGGLWFYDNASRRGVQVRADGVAGGRNGRLTYIATRYNSAAPTDVADYASLLVSSESVLGGYAGVSIRNALSVIGPGDVSGPLGVGGATDLNGPIYLNAGIARRDAGNIQFNRGLDVNVGDIRLTATTAQGIRSVGGTPLELYAPTSFIRINNALRAEAGLIVTGGLSIPANSIGQAELAASTDTDANRAVHIHHCKDSLRNPAQGSLGLRTISTFLGGTGVQAAASDHSHGSGNTMDFDMLGDARVEKILKLRDALRARKNATGAVSRTEYNGLLALTLVLAHILFDAPDLSADERLAKRRAGESGWDDFMFEWRRGKQLNVASEGKATVEGEYLHHPSLKHYANPTPDVTDIPA